MKKLLIGIIVLGITSCGSHTCDAYHKSDYTKYKTNKYPAGSLEKKKRGAVKLPLFVSQSLELIF